MNPIVNPSNRWSLNRIWSIIQNIWSSQYQRCEELKISNLKIRISVAIWVNFKIHLITFCYEERCKFIIPDKGRATKKVLSFFWICLFVCRIIWFACAFPPATLSGERPSSDTYATLTQYNLQCSVFRIVVAKSLTVLQLFQRQIEPHTITIITKCVCARM